MLMPSIFGSNFIDDFFGVPEKKATHVFKSTMMQTDVKETDAGYEVTMDLPGYNKEDVSAELKDGYLVITASTNSSNDTQDDDGKYIRKERYSGSCQRSFYVGDDLKQEDIKARFENGTLKLDIPKKDAQPKVEEKAMITIE